MLIIIFWRTFIIVLSSSRWIGIWVIVIWFYFLLNFKLVWVIALTIFFIWKIQLIFIVMSWNIKDINLWRIAKWFHFFVLAFHNIRYNLEGRFICKLNFLYWGHNFLHWKPLFLNYIIIIFKRIPSLIYLLHCFFFIFIVIIIHKLSFIFKFWVNLIIFTRRYIDRISVFFFLRYIGLLDITFIARVTEVS